MTPKFNLYAKELPYYLLFTFSFVHGFTQNLTLSLNNGTSLSSLKRTYSEDIKLVSIPGWLCGIGLDYNFNPIFSIGTELNYKSLLITENNAAINNRIMYNPPNYYNKSFEYATIPLFFTLTTPTRLKVSVSGGAYYSYLLNQEFITKKSNIGYLLGARLSYNISPEFELSLNARYNEDFNEFSTGYKMSSKDITVGIRYKFSESKKVNKVVKTSDSISNNSQFHFKFRAGTTLNTIESSYLGNQYSNIIGSSSSLILNYSVNENVGLQTELIYEDNGYHMSDSTSSNIFALNNNTIYFKNNVNSNVRNTYITIPLLAEIKFFTKTIFYINGGAYFSLLVDSETSGTKTSEYYNTGYYYKYVKNISESTYSLFNKSDFGLIAGMGIRIPLKKNWQIEIDLRRKTGLKNIINKNIEQYNFNIPTETFIKNKNTTLSIGLSIPVN